MGGRGHIHDGLRYPIMHLGVNGARKECTILAPFLCQFWVSHHGSVSWELKKGVPFYPLFVNFGFPIMHFCVIGAQKGALVYPFSDLFGFPSYIFCVIGAQKGALVYPFSDLFGFPSYIFCVIGAQKGALVYPFQ